MPEEENQNQQPLDVAKESPSESKTQDPSKLNRFKHWYGANRKLSLPATLLLVVFILAAIPFTRYAFAGTVIKKDFTVKILDSTSAEPVSGAKVSIGAVSAETDATGKAVLKHVSAGRHTVNVSKKYYSDATHSETVPILKEKSEPFISLQATGRQVKITITNAIDKTPLSNVEISAAGTTAKTDESGTALLVVPAGVSQQQAKLSLNGYNGTTVTIKVSNDSIINNEFSLTPAGKVYFLSKLSGKIDVVKTNLDGSVRQTVLPGTGNEDDQNTVLLASRDWKYLALLSRRAGANPSLFLIDTSNDSTAVIDSGSYDFSLTGWSGDRFIYTVTRGDVPLWQPGRQVIKSYNPDTKKVTVLDQTNASGTGNYDYLSQLLGAVYAYEDQVYYIMNWTSSYGGTADISTKQATLNSVKPDGTAKKAIKSFALATGAQTTDVVVDERVKNPDAIELYFSDGSKDNFYVYGNGQVKPEPGMTAETFYSANYPTYLLSPSGNNTFWSDPRDGKNTLFVGDSDGAGGKQIATLSDYSPYGWYTDDYLLVSKNSSELYIMDKDGKQTPLKISDYHKPSQSFPGYGGGYGGL